MSDIVTLKTRQDIQVHVDNLQAATTTMLESLVKLQRHARGPEKAKWQRVQTKAHRLINYVDRVLRSV